MFNLSSLTDKKKKAPPPTSSTANSPAQSNHRTLIALVHTKTLALSKLISKSPRKHRDIAGALDEANDALEEFREVEWPPPRQSADLLTLPSWLEQGDGDDNDDGMVMKPGGFGSSVESSTAESSDGALQQQQREDTVDEDASGGDSRDVITVNKDEEKREDESQQELGGDAVDSNEDGVDKEQNNQGDDENNGVEDDENNGVDDSDGIVDDRETDESSIGAEDMIDAIENDIKANKHKALTEKEESEKDAKLNNESTVTPPPPAPQSTIATSTTSTSNSSSERQKTRPPSTNVVVDAAAMEPMHPAVITTLHGLCTIISSDSKTPKMAEMALEIITLLTNNRYVTGVAGGRMKLEQQRKQLSQQQQQQHGTNSTLDAATNGKNTMAPITTMGHDGRDGTLTFLGYVVESITRASDSPSDQVQSHMSKALLSIMTCPKCGVHEAAMLQAVRSTFHVYLVSKSVEGRSLAKRTLVDMLKSVFNRMEAYDVMNVSSHCEESGVTTTDESDNDAEQHHLALSPSPSRDNDDGSTTDATAQTSGTDSTKMDNNESSTLSPIPASANAANNSIGAFASQYHTDSYLLFRALCKLSSKTLPGDENVVGMNTSTPGGAAANFFSNTQPQVDPLALNSKILSLELILAVFEHCGDAFRNGEKFIYAVQSYLCVSLLKNCMSNQTSLAHLSLKIFLLLVKKFKSHLKSEIEVFVANIFLRVLESPNSPFEQKVLVLEALRALCADPQMLTQLFLNYDCDFDAVNLYKDIVHHVTRLSAKSCAPSNSLATVTKKDLDQEIDLSRTGLEVLVVILRSFLKALDLPGGDDVFDENDGSSSLSLLRQNLKLDITKESDFDDKITNRNEHGTSIQPALSENNAEGDQQQELKRKESSSGFAEKIVDAFDKKRTAEQNFEIGMVKFTLSLKTGLLFFIDSGFVQLDARDMARFLYENAERLDKTQTGEVLGKEIDSSFVKDPEANAENGGKGFFLRVLHHYVDLMNFDTLLFDDAIRLFLSGFRLPGEAQKIDRIMEKFAERYTRQNPDVFPNADTAFILAFSVIMLNTDLHNPSIKPEKRMTLESFIRNNRGISVDGGDLPSEFLSGIFSRIKEQPFSLKEDDDAREKAATKENTTFDSLFVFEGPFGTTSEDKKREKFRKEREEMMAASEQLFKKRPAKQNTKKSQSQEASLDAVSPGDVVKPMFDVTWGPLIGTLSQVLESSSNETINALCLGGFVYSIRLSSHSGMSLARNTFVNSLCKFTTLGSIKEMKRKNIECIRTLLSIAIIDGEFLGESWSPILQCISQLGRLHLFASGLDSEDQFLEPGSPHFAKISDAAREMEENNGKAVLAAVNEILIDKVFSSTVTLSGRGIVSFIDQLIAVSEAEISGDTKKGISGVSSIGSSPALPSKSKVTSSGHGNEGPRIFSLQRLVEVADYNMNIRPRLTWSQIWENMGSHFAKVGCNTNSMVSMFAIDALRQLSFKFLEKPELSDFNFQRLFLKPFLVIMESPESREDTRELVLRCVDNIIRSLACNLRSGWKIFFSVLMRSSSDASAKINTLGLAILQRLLDEHLNELFRVTDLAMPENSNESDEISSLERRQRNTNAEDFTGLCHASLSFVQIKESENPLPIGLSMRALCHTACYADLIADKLVLPPVSGHQCAEPLSCGYTYEGLSEHESLEMALWRPLFDGLAAGMSSPASSISAGVGCLVQRGSLMALRAILLRHGKLFSINQWSTILKSVVLPAMQVGAESDSTPVLQILSDSPSLSLDFLGEPLPPPPSSDDEGLKKFAEVAHLNGTSPKRKLGNAELLVEASFVDLRQGGDGDLSKAYRLKKEDAENRSVELQPFPDSWIASTAPIALGMISDLIGSHFVELGAEGREALWPLVLSQLLRWSVGENEHDVDVMRVENDNGTEILIDTEGWQPCEALVRIGCREWGRCIQSVADAISRIPTEETQGWLITLIMHLSKALRTNTKMESKCIEKIVQTKLRVMGIKNGGQSSSNTEADASSYLNLLPSLKIRCVASHCLQQYILPVCDLQIFTQESQASSVLKSLRESRSIARSAQENGDLAHAFQEACFDQWGVNADQVDAALLRSNSQGWHRGSCPIFFLTQEAGATKAEILLLSHLYSSKPQDIIHSDGWGNVTFAEPLLFERIQEVLVSFLESEDKDGPNIDPNVWRNATESGCQVAYYCTSFVGVVIHIIEIIRKLEPDKFSRHKETVFPMLCALVCSQSDEIRHLISDIFRSHVGPLIGVADTG